MPVVPDGAREIREGLVQLPCRGDERVVAKGRDRRLGSLRPLAGVEDPLDAIVEPEERELAGDDLLGECLTAPRIVELHELVRGGQRVVALAHHLAHVVGG